MKYLTLIIFLFSLSFASISCADDEKLQQAEILRAQKRNDEILSIISSNWNFAVPPPTSKVQMRVGAWTEWQQFRTELAQKPKHTLAAYRQKTKNLAEKADQLRNNIPPMFDKPQVRSRIGVLITKIRSLYTFISINEVQEKKVVNIIGDITKETISMQNQLDEIIRFSEIRREAGEEEMLRALDTTRMANPDAQPQPQVTPATPMPATHLLQQKRMQQLQQNQQ